MSIQSVRNEIKSAMTITDCSGPNISNAEMNYKRMSDLSTVGTAGAKVFGDMASSALSGMNSLAAAIEQTSL